MWLKSRTIFKAIQNAVALVVLVRRQKLKLDWGRQPNVSAGCRGRSLSLRVCDCQKGQMHRMADAIMVESRVWGLRVTLSMLSSIMGVVEKEGEGFRITCFEKGHFGLMQPAGPKV